MPFIAPTNAWFENTINNTNIDKELSSGNGSSKKSNKLIKIMVILIIAVILFFVILYFVFSSKFNDAINDLYGGGSSSDKSQYFLILNGNEEVVVYKNSTYFDEGFSAYDNNGNTYNEEVSVLGEVDTSIVGEYKIIYSFRDIQKTRKVNVIFDNKHNTYLVLSGDSQVNLKVGDKYVEPGYNVFDSIDSNLNSLVKISGSVNTQNVGTYKLIYSVTNSSGVTVTAERTIIVRK